MKIAVCVKEVPDATAARRIDPASRRLDRSGEKTLNPYDAHALEEALRLKEGPAGADSQITALCMGPEARAADAAQGALAGRRRGAAGQRPGARGRRHRRRPRACSPRPLEAPRRRSRAARPAGVGLRLLRDGRGVADHLQLPLVTQVARLELDGDGSAPSARPRRATTSSRRRCRPSLGLRRDQRAALRLAQGDHGRASKKPQTTLALADLGVARCRAHRGARADAAAREGGRPAHRGRGRLLGRGDRGVPARAEGASDGRPPGLLRAARRRRRRRARSACSRRRRGSRPRSAQGRRRGLRRGPRRRRDGRARRPRRAHGLRLRRRRARQSLPQPMVDALARRARGRRRTTSCC